MTNQMNGWDSLLAWLSLSEKHKWSNVKANCRRLSALYFPNEERSPLWDAMRWAGALIQLGHAEFDPGKRTVSACPPGLVIANSGLNAVLYGYWDPRLRKRLKKIGAMQFSYSPKSGPTCWAIEASGPVVDAITEWKSVWISEDTSVHLLKRLPLFSAVLNDLEPSQVSAEGNWDRFGYFTDLRWSWRPTTSSLTEPGLYRLRKGNRACVFVREGKRLALNALDQKLAAKWACYNQRDNWLFDPGRKQLFVPYGTPDLPILVSRGLTMSSARLPTQASTGKRRYLRYVSVGEQQAIEAARIMEQEITIRSLTGV